MFTYHVLEVDHALPKQVTVGQSLKWNEHVANICSKLNKRLYFLKQLKQAGMSTGDLLCFYKSVIRPVAEYACHVWHSSLTVEQSNRIEARFENHLQ